MADIMFYLAPLAMAVVAIILGLGLWNMVRGGNNAFAQKMMRYRVVAQFVAVFVLIAAWYYAKR